MIQLKPTYRKQDVDRAKQIVLEIVRQSANGEIVGAAKLFRAFYLSHLYFASQQTGYLSEWPIIKLPIGPGIDAFELLIDELKRDSAIETEPEPVGPYISTRYRATRDIPTCESLSSEAVRAVRDAVRLLEAKSGTEFTEMTREFSRSWHEAAVGQEMAIYTDLLSDEVHRNRQQAARNIQESVSAAWNS